MNGADITSGMLQRLDGLAKGVIPTLFAVLLVVLSLVPLRAPEVAPVMPALGLTAIYYWAVFRPDLLPVWLVFLLGLLQDLLTGMPLGVSVLAMVAMHLFVSSQRRIFVNASFLMLWVVFALFSASALALAWLAGSLLAGALADPRLLLLQYVLTVGVYPCLAWLFGRAQQLLL